MAINRRQTSVPRDQVWKVLSDGHRYADWVVGASDIRDVDDGFPAVGRRLHYTVGRGPIRHEGHTAVMSVEAGRRLELEAHAWPLGTAQIIIRLTDGDSGCLVEIEEHPRRGLARRLHNPVVDLGIKLRNLETLRRLERVAAAAQA